MTVVKYKVAQKQIWLLLFLYFVANKAFAGAWVPEVGSGYTKYAVSNYEATEFFGENTAAVEFSGRNYSFYGEYGFASNLAVYGTVLYQQLEQMDREGVTTESSGLGDVELGVRYQWLSDPFVLSTSLLTKLPYLYDEKDELPRGNGQEDYELRILLGKSLNNYGYLGFEAGYRYRTQSPSDEYRYLFEYGFSANDNLYFRTKLDAIISVKNADTQNADTESNSNSNLTMASEYDLTKWELTAGWNLGNSKKNKSRWGIEFTYRQDIAGDNTLNGDGVELGLTKVF